MKTKFQIFTNVLLNAMSIIMLIIALQSCSLFKNNPYKTEITQEYEMIIFMTSPFVFKEELGLHTKATLNGNVIYNCEERILPESNDNIKCLAKQKAQDELDKYLNKIKAIENYKCE